MTTLSPILGHERVLRRLYEAQDGDRWHHAYLLEGPQGVGKHLIATRLAMRANCEAAPEVRPCGQCGTCRRILAGTHPDVITVQPAEDRASQTISVTQIREVIRTAGYHRYDARQRFVIIDPAESMHPGAANALLKTLEEPPEGTGFFLIATHTSALLPTIRSRCQRIRFGSIPVDILGEWLAAREAQRPHLIARLADGCPGRALALAAGGLEERMSLRQEFLQTLAADLQTIFAFSQATCAGGRAVWTGRVHQLLELIEELLRDALIVATACDTPPIHEDLMPVLEAWAGALWPNGIERCVRAVQETRDDLTLNVTGKTTLDALFTRLATELGTARKAGA